MPCLFLNRCQLLLYILVTVFPRKKKYFGLLIFGKNVWEMPVQKIFALLVRKPSGNE